MWKRRAFALSGEPGEAFFPRLSFCAERVVSRTLLEACRATVSFTLLVRWRQRASRGQRTRFFHWRRAVLVCRCDVGTAPGAGNGVRCASR